ncbi:MAG: sugar phosphate isomerase/epimerase [Clostridia bacterium]|nr:sugar phosphate isomerase/epimerase [Clostridia bacterium]
MRIGVRAHDFGKLPVELLADRIAEKKLSCIQLALMKAIEGIDEIDGRLNPGFAYTIGEAFRRRNVQIAVLGCYINLVDPDVTARKSQIERFKEHIRYARDLGCSVIATETGSFNSDWSFNPWNHGEEAFVTLCESVSEMVKEAERFGVFVGIEGVTTHVIHNPARMKRLLDTIGSSNLQVVFDPVNLLSPDNYHNQKKIIEECFELFGDRIVAVHIKDFTIEQGKKKAAAIGKGLFDYETVMRLLQSQKPHMNMLIEEANPETVKEDMEFLQSVYGKTCGNQTESV